MKLACLRCKHKKIKCDKAEPTCHQCITASAECVYVERRKRPRLSQQKNEVRNLSRRLEFLEQHLNGPDNATPSSRHSREESTDTSTESQPTLSPDASLMNENGQDSWIYRLASDARRNFEKVNTQSHSTPAETLESSTVDSAMSALNEALDGLGKLRLRSDESMSRGPELNLSPDEARACVRICLDMMSSLIIPDFFLSNLNLDLGILEVLPDIANSPFINVDPAVRVIYYNALYYGLFKLRGPGNPQSLAAYYKVLEAVPAWLGAASRSDLDAPTAALTTWTAINNFDYQLSWKFHCKACQFLKMKGIDRLDVLHARSHEEEEKRQNLRFLYWHVLQTDLLFRIFYGKPSALRWSSAKVKPPPLFTASNMQPKASTAMLYVIWVRYNVMTAELFNALDSCPAAARGSPEIQRQVDEYCSGLEELIDEWDMMSRMKAPAESAILTWLYADYAMNAYASIIGVRRLIRQLKPETPVDAVTLRAARTVISIILHFNRLSFVPDENNSIFFHFISFYPFCAVFSLYEHILACTNPDDCEDDLKALENIGSVMKEACGVYSDFVPFSNTINALNKVSRTIQNSRRKQPSPLMSGESMDTTNPSTTPATTNTPKSPSQKQQQQQPQPQQPLPWGINLPTSTADAFQMLSSPGFDLSGPAFPSFSDVSMNNASGEVQPLDFIRALENDFIGRNWHETWWEMDGDINAGLDDIPETSYSKYVLPTGI